MAEREGFGLDTPSPVNDFRPSYADRSRSKRSDLQVEVRFRHIVFGRAAGRSSRILSAFANGCARERSLDRADRQPRPAHRPGITAGEILRGRQQPARYPAARPLPPGGRRRGAAGIGRCDEPCRGRGAQASGAAQEEAALEGHHHLRPELHCERSHVDRLQRRACDGPRPGVQHLQPADQRRWRQVQGAHRGPRTRHDRLDRQRQRHLHAQVHVAGGRPVHAAHQASRGDNIVGSPFTILWARCRSRAGARWRRARW